MLINYTVVVTAAVNMNHILFITVIQDTCSDEITSLCLM